MLLSKGPLPMGPKNSGSRGQGLTHSLVHHFETVPNSKKLQMTVEMWLLQDFKIQIAQKILWEKKETADFEQFHLFPQCFPKAFFFSVLK